MANRLSTTLLICPGCYHKNGSPEGETVGQYRLYTCAACELTFSDPMRAGSIEFYESNTEYDDKWEFKFLYDKLKQFGLTGALLDIGCGDGRFLETMRERFAVTGLDWNVRAIQVAKSKRHLVEVFPATLEEFMKEFPSRKYDVITFFHILEHVEEPKKFIANLRQCLKSGGMIAVSVPNPNRWTLRWMREAWDYPPHHLTRWSSQNLRSFLEKHGFEVVETHTETMLKLSQIRNAIRDIIWAIVFKRFSFGMAAKLDVGSGGGAVLKKGISAELKRVSLRILRSILVNLKGRAIQSLSQLLTLLAYPSFLFGNYGGRSLLILARLGDEESLGT